MTLAYFPLKLGDTDPPFECILNGPSGPVDLTGVDAIQVAYRDRPSGDVLLTKTASVVGTATDGRIRHTWAEGDAEILFGVPEDDSVAVVRRVAEVEVLRSGTRTTWPTEGYVEIRVWRDIVADQS